VRQKPDGKRLNAAMDNEPGRGELAECETKSTDLIASSRLSSHWSGLALGSQDSLLLSFPGIGRSRWLHSSHFGMRSFGFALLPKGVCSRGAMLLCHGVRANHSACPI
jgi:hypothetical protein